MSVSVIEYPQKFVNGHLSKWQAAHQPITFKIQRQDQSVYLRMLHADGFVRLKMNGVCPSTVSIGQSIMYSDGVTKRNWTITNIITTSSSGYWIHTTGTITGAVYGGFVNFTDAYKNYFVETRILAVNQSIQYAEIGTSKNKVDLNGIANVNIQEWVRSKCEFQNEFNYDSINYAVIGEGGKYSIQFREIYNGVSLPYVNLGPLNYWTNSAKQIQEIYGANMGEYVPTLDNSRTELAKFQSVFERPTFFVGWPFSLNFIWSDNMLNIAVTREEETFNVNGTTVAATSDALNPSHRFAANRLMLKDNYTSNVKTLDVWLNSTGVGIPYSPIDYNNNYSDGTIFQPFTENDSATAENQRK